MKIKKSLAPSRPAAGSANSRSLQPLLKVKTVFTIKSLLITNWKEKIPFTSQSLYKGVNETRLHIDIISIISQGIITMHIVSLLIILR